jgi:sporulation protein YabP
MTNTQRLLLQGRKHLEISGVGSVDSFDNEQIELNTELGGLLIYGDGLKIDNLNLEQGQVIISGIINTLSYGKTREERSAKTKSKNILGRILK